MKRFIFPAIALLLLLVTNQARGQFCTADDRYTATPIFSDAEVMVDRSVLFATAPDRNGSPQNLLLDVYFPSDDVDTAQLRPLVLLIHGGGFRDGDRDGLAFECLEFARRGFVAATIDYRLGFDRRDPVDYLSAIYRAEQDALAALRYLGSAVDDYRVDPAWAFIGGVSAGSITSLNAVYADDTDWDGIVPGITQRLGVLQSSGNQLPVTLQLRGVFNNWGSTLPTAITPAEMLPTIAFHGLQDMTVPIDLSPTGLIGSRLVHQRLLDEGVCSDLTVDPEGRHGVYVDSLGTIARVAKASCFFKRLFCDDCQSVTATELVPAACDFSVSVGGELLRDPITLYPNPTFGELNVRGLPANAQVAIFRTTGQVIYQGDGWLDDALRHQPAGVYYVRFTLDGRSQLERVLKVK